MAARSRTRFWAGRERAARLLRADALPDRRDRRRLRRAGPAPLLRLLGGDADPALRPDRRLGRAGRLAATIKFVIYTMAGSLLMLGVDRSSSASSRARSTWSKIGHERRALDLPRLRRRVRGQGAALPVPRLAARRLPRVAAGGRRGALGRDLEGGRVRLPPHRDREVPRRRRRTTCATPILASRRSGWSTARCSPSARPTCAA